MKDGLMQKLCECGCGQPAPIAAQTEALDGRVKGQPTRFIHGHNQRGKPGICGIRNGKFRHGGTNQPEYRVYYNAKTRCTDRKHQSWKYYGGRGIKFLFISFKQFYTELGPRPAGLTLDRINNDGHYQVGNVRWATRSQQALNARKRKQHESS